MVFFKSASQSGAIRSKVIATLLAASAALPIAAVPSWANAQSVSLEIAPISELNKLRSNWERQNEAMRAAQRAIQEHTQTSEDVRATVDTQKAKIEGAKNGLSAAVVKLTEAKNRLSRVDTSNEDPKGEELSQLLIKAQTELNRVISASEKSKAEKEALKSEHEKLRSTIGQLKKAVSAANAAASAAAVYVDAVKSAQAVLAENDSDLQSDFYTDALKQAEVAQKSSQVAQQALTVTRERQTEVAERLLKIEELLTSAKQAEIASFDKFAKADEIYKNHQIKIEAQRDERDALISEINAERELAEEQLKAQKEILQSETLAMQDVAAQEQATINKMDDLQSDLDQIRAAFDDATEKLRAAQHTHSIQSAAIVANLNSLMASTLRDTVPGADKSTPSARFILPADQLFAKNSAKIRRSDDISMANIATQVKVFAGQVPEGVSWIVRVDNYASGGSDDSWFLSQNRALSIAQSLIANGKFDPSRVSANGLVKTQPISDATSGGWVEIVLTAR